MPKGDATRYPGLTLRVLGRSAAAMGPGKAELIERIGRTGSISAAARQMGMSYRRAWQLVVSLNETFREPVVTTAIGGKRGGGARITPFAEQLVARFRAMEVEATKAISAELRHFESELRKAPKRR